MLVDTTESLIKNELKGDIITVTQRFQNQGIPTEVIQEIEEKIENNETIKSLMNTYYDKIIEVLIDHDATIQFDISEDLDTLIEEGEQILNDYGITITPEEKQELLSMVSSDQINELVNEVVTDMKSNMNGEVGEVIDAYVFFTSTTFKMILGGLILLSVVFLALLKKSYYGWLSNFGIASLVSGFFMGVMIPLLGDVLSNLLEESGIIISTSSIQNYGYILIGFGLVFIVISIILKKILVKTADVVES